MIKVTLFRYRLTKKAINIQVLLIYTPSQNAILIKVMEKLKIYTNYHTHTKRCGHAGGTDEEYVLSAIKNGYKELGFSDHVFLPNFSQPNTRGEYYELQNYISSIEKLKEKYKDQIILYKGFECEGLYQYYDYYRNLLQTKTCDYLILGNHLSLEGTEGNYSVKSFFYNCDTNEKLEEYVESSIKSLETHLFKIFAHPDLFLGFVENLDEKIEEQCWQLINCAIKLDIPLELNMGGIRQDVVRLGKIERKKYPTDFFWNLVSKTNAKIILGVDAHGPRDFDDSIHFDNIRNFVKKHNLKLLDRIDIK